MQWEGCQHGLPPRDAGGSMAQRGGYMVCRQGTRAEAWLSGGLACGSQSTPSGAHLPGRASGAGGLVARVGRAKVAAVMLRSGPGGCDAEGPADAGRVVEAGGAAPGHVHTLQRRNDGLRVRQARRVHHRRARRCGLLLLLLPLLLL